MLPLFPQAQVYYFWWQPDTVFHPCMRPGNPPFRTGSARRFRTWWKSVSLPSRSVEEPMPSPDRHGRRTGWYFPPRRHPVRSGPHCGLFRASFPAQSLSRSASWTHASPSTRREKRWPFTAKRHRTGRCDGVVQTLVREWGGQERSALLYSSGVVAEKVRRGAPLSSSRNSFWVAASTRQLFTSSSSFRKRAS